MARAGDGWIVTGLVVQAHPAVAQAAKDALAAQVKQLAPVVLCHEIRQSQAPLTARADATPFAESAHDPKADVNAFLSGLRPAWKEGEIRPTSRKKPPARPDPRAKVPDDLRAWIDEDPSRTGRDLLSRLQAAHPDACPDRLIRTGLRRVKTWRADMARSLVFCANGDAQPQMNSNALRNLEAARVKGHLEPTEPRTTTGENPREQMDEATA